MSAPAEVWIVPPHADRTLPAVLCPEQQDCIHMARGAIRSLEIFIHDVERGNSVAAESSRKVAWQIVQQLGPAWFAFHAAMAGCEPEICQACGNVTDVDCRCDDDVEF